MLSTHFPKLLACVFSADSLQDLCTSWVLIYEAVHLVNIVVDDDV